MKRILLKLVLLNLAATIALPLIGLAQVGAPTYCTIRADTGIAACPTPGETATYERLYDGVSGAICCLMSTINYFVNWIFFLLLAVAVIVGIMGGYSIITSGGDPAKVESGRRMILYAIIGVIVALFARAIPPIARMMVGV